MRFYVRLQIAVMFIAASNNSVGHYRDIINGPRSFRPRYYENAEEHNPVMRLIAARARCEESEPVDTSINEIRGPICAFNSYAERSIARIQNFLVPIKKH